MALQERTTWSAFIRSRRGALAGVLALLALAAFVLAPPPGPELAGLEFMLALLAMACVAVMAFRDQPQLARGRADA